MASNLFQPQCVNKLMEAWKNDRHFIHGIDDKPECIDSSDCLAPHYNDVITGAMASQINSLTIVYPNVYSGTDQRKHQSSASLSFVTGIHRWPVNSPHKGPVTRKVFPFDDVIIKLTFIYIKDDPVHCWYMCHQGRVSQTLSSSLI